MSIHTHTHAFRYFVDCVSTHIKLKPTELKAKVDSVPLEALFCTKKIIFNDYKKGRKRIKYTENLSRLDT